jgi:hypothetical protein
LARGAYKLFAQNPNHQSLRFKRLPPSNDRYSVRIGIGYRALGTMKNSGADIYWYWIGTREEYGKLI